MSEQSSDGPTLSELVARELKVLEAIDGVVSARMYARRRKSEPLNKNLIKVRMRDRDNPLTVHCSATVPDLRVAAEQMMVKVAAIVGSEAVAEGRLRIAAQREAAVPAAAAASGQKRSSEQAGQPLNFFERSRRIQEFEAEKARAAERVRDADGLWRSKLLLVSTEQKAVQLAQLRLDDARAAAEAAKEPLARAQAAAAEARASLEQLRSKRQRLDEEPSASADAPASVEEDAQEEADLGAEFYKDYTLETFRKLESEEVKRRRQVPKRGVQRNQPRLGKLVRDRLAGRRLSESTVEAEVKGCRTNSKPSMTMPHMDSNGDRPILQRSRYKSVTYVAFG